MSRSYGRDTRTLPFALIGTVVFSAIEHQNGLARLVSVSDDNNDLPWVLALL
jgi:hypothetical protein